MSSSTSRNYVHPSPIPIQSLDVFLPSLPPRHTTAPVPHPMVKRSQSKEQSNQPQSQCLTATTVPIAFVEPITYQEALSVPVWAQAMKEEFQAL